MSRSSTSRPVLPADWLEVLGKVQQTLEEADAVAAKREEIVKAGLDTSVGLRPRFASAIIPLLQQVRERLDGLGSYTDRAARAVSDADVALGAGEEALRTWLQASEAGRRKLAEWVGRG
jgi:hypothetical protein